eukprot:GDKK01043938.1.p1 GENE.GDKK01043938.1~~GDKK01043938.1.p1  ORF type:complete len:152 (-),score=19.40 GDKK01043938.1:50-481(-)
MDKEEYHINVHWLATNEETKGPEIFQKFLDALPRGEAATTPLIKSWPAAAQRYVEDHFKIPSITSSKVTVNTAVTDSVTSETPLSVAAPSRAASTTFAKDGDEEKKNAPSPALCVVKVAVAVAVVAAVAAVVARRYKLTTKRI